MNKQKGISTITIILLVLVFILAGALVFQYFSKANPSPGEPGDSGDGGEAADWQEYKNKEYGVNFEYPKDWEVIRDDSGYQTAACQANHSQEGCVKVFNIVLGKDGYGLLGINTRQCNNIIELTPLDYFICLDFSLSSEQIYEQPFSGEEKLKYLNSGTQKALNKIRNTFSTEGQLPVPNAPVLYYSEATNPYVQINWNYSIADYFNVYRAESEEGPWKKIIEALPQSAHTAVDYDIPEGASVLYYRITSLDGEHRESDYSEISSVDISDNTE
jgi:hypothetical protein